MSIASEFRDFIAKGNVVDLAVGVIIGGAFGKIVTSLIGDIIMPALSPVLGNINFADLKYVITPADVATKTAEVAIRYGAFFNVMFEFVILAFVIFLMVRMINSLRRQEAVEAAPAGPTTSEVLLSEIRDLLKK